MFKRNLFIFAAALTLYVNPLVAITVNPQEALSDDDNSEFTGGLISSSDSDEMNMDIGQSEHSEPTSHFAEASELSTQSPIFSAPPGTGKTGFPAALAAMHGLSLTMSPTETAAEVLTNFMGKVIFLVPNNAENFPAFMNAFANVIQNSDDWKEYNWVWDGITLEKVIISHIIL